ncbi:MAG: Rrf2 family transcriptional regulator [Anaerolineae bacterium]|nr:Rrf2 family transcriptional regulator [Anaerolineae bacterium]MDW8070065.1 Rrf2 family transcriptional regulator [Anaerolineae bacterium]
MRISTRGRYALRALLDVALHESEGPVSRQDIAARQEISAEYLAQLFRSLATAGLVRGVKGPGGGYVLGRDPATIRVGDVLRAVEGPIAAVHCAIPQTGNRRRCRRIDSCVTHLVWEQMSTTINNMLDSVTLKDLCLKARELAGLTSECNGPPASQKGALAEAGYMYVI